MKLTSFLLFTCSLMFGAADASDRLLSALADRALADQVARMKTDDRIAMYEQMGTAQPENFHYKNLLATAFIQKMRETADFGYLERASRIVNQVLAAEGRNYEAMRLRSGIELERHNFALVVELSREMAKLAPEDPWNWATLGDALMERGEYEEAAGAYQRAISLRPDLASYNRAAYYRFVAGDAAGAVELMRRAIEAGSSSPENVAWCLVELGNMYWKTGRVQEAERSFAASVRLFPGYHAGHAGLGRVLAARGNIRDAIAHYRRAQAAVPLVEYTAALETLYTLEGNESEAVSQRKLVDIADQLDRAVNQKANRNLALVFADQDRNAGRALELARAELAVRGDVYTQDALAWTLYRNGKLVEAAKAAEMALRLNTPEPGFHYHAGMIERALGHKEGARKHLARALELNEQFDLAQAPLARKALQEVSK